MKNCKNIKYEFNWRIGKINNIVKYKSAKQMNKLKNGLLLVITVFIVNMVNAQCSFI